MCSVEGCGNLVVTKFKDLKLCWTCYGRRRRRGNPARRAEQLRRYHKKHANKIREYNKFYRVKKLYGLDKNAYAALLSVGCEICGSREKLCVDHCHESGRVRGCLCGACNLRLGHFEQLRKLTGWISEAEAYLAKAS